MVAVQQWPLWLSIGAMTIIVVVGGVWLAQYLWRNRHPSQQQVADHS